jgi:hypothetical protein
MNTGKSSPLFVYDLQRDAIVFVSDSGPARIEVTRLQEVGWTVDRKELMAGPCVGIARTEKKRSHDIVYESAMSKLTYEEQQEIWRRIIRNQEKEGYQNGAGQQQRQSGYSTKSSS